MLTAQLWATSDINVARQSANQGFKVIFLGDPISIEPIDKDVFVVATALTPDYNTMSALIDGDENMFAGMYAASLNTKPAVDMFALIFACLFKGVGIMFYIPPEAISMNFVNYLLKFIEVNYGITTQTKSTMYSFNPAFSSRIIELLYLSDLVTAQEFLVNSENIDDITLRKLVTELHPMVEDPRDISQIVGWFSAYKDNLVNSKAPLVNGVQFAGEVSEYAIGG